MKKQKPIGYIVVWREPGGGTEFLQGFDDEEGAPPNAIGGTLPGEGVVMFDTRADARRAIKRTHHWRLAKYECDNDLPDLKIEPAYPQKPWERA